MEPNTTTTTLPTIDNGAPAITPADIKGAMEARRTELARRLARLRGERFALNQRIADTKVEWAEADRYLRALEPRTRRPKAETK